MADLSREQAAPLSSLLEPLRVGTAAAAGLLLHSLSVRTEPAVMVISLLLVAQAWTPGIDRDVRGSLIAGSLLVPLAASWDVNIAALMLSVIMLQGSWVAYGGAVAATFGTLLLLGIPAGMTLPAAVGPSAIMAAGVLSTERQRKQQLEFRGRLQSVRERAQQAQDLNDQIIQQVAAASWAAQQGDAEQAARLSEEALENARNLVSRLQGEGDPG